MTDQTTPEALAQLFHETYERLAPEHGYRTREASAKPWADVPDANKALMIATCAEVLNSVDSREQAAIAELDSINATVIQTGAAHGLSGLAAVRQLGTRYQEEKDRAERLSRAYNAIRAERNEARAEADSDPVVLDLRAQLEEARRDAGSEHGRAAAFEAAHREARTRCDARDAEIDAIRTHTRAYLPSTEDAPILVEAATDRRRLLDEVDRLRAELAASEQARTAALDIAADTAVRGFGYRADRDQARVELELERRDHEQTRQAAAKAVVDVARLEQARAAGWYEGYALGVNDERTAESNIGIAGFGAKVNPARENPYRAHEPATATGTPGPDPSEGTGSPERPEAAYEAYEAPCHDCRTADLNDPAPLTLAGAAGALHDWAGDLDDGTRTDWPAGHPDIIRGIRAAADWLDARDRYEQQAREQAAAKAAAPTLRDVIRTMRSIGVHLRPVGDTSDYSDDRTWDLTDTYTDQIGTISHETHYWGERWTAAFGYERGPEVSVSAATLEPAEILTAARLAGLIGDTDA